MSDSPASQRVEVTFARNPPARQIQRAAGVTEMEVLGQTVRCRVHGSFQPLLEAVQGYEVINLISVPEP